MYHTQIETEIIFPGFKKITPIHLWNDGTETLSHDIHYEYNGVKILDWGNHRDGRLVGKIVVKFDTYNSFQKQRCYVLKSLIDSIKTYGDLPVEATVVASRDEKIDIEEGLFKWCRKYPLTSLNTYLGQNGDIPDEIFIFAMSDENALELNPVEFQEKVRIDTVDEMEINDEFAFRISL